MVSAAGRQSGRPDSMPPPKVVVVLGGPDREGNAYRVESLDRVLRMCALLSEAGEEFRQVTLPPEALDRVRRQLKAVTAEIDRSVSPALVGELHHLLGPGGAEHDMAEVRIEYTALLGWVSGLVIGILSQLEAARNDLYLADRSLAELRADRGHRG